MIPRARHAAPGEVALAVALSPWESLLVRESLVRWLTRGAIAALALAVAVLLVGWVTPLPEGDLRPWAFQLAVVPMIVAALIAVWPYSRLHRAADVDARLDFGDRLTTAWTFRASDEPIVHLQRSDAIDRLRTHPPNVVSSRLRPSRSELVILGTIALAFAMLLVVPSPQQAVLDRQAAEELAIAQASDRLDTLREEALANPSLSADQARQLDELLHQAQAELNRSHSQQEALATLARAQDQVAQQLGDPNADLRNEALAAMSETLAAEPRTQALADAIQREDARAASDALKDMAAQADQLSAIERQALSRALQRAANVGRGDPRTASALRDAAQALGSNSGSASAALSAADAALADSLQSSKEQASVNAALQRLRELQSQLAAGGVQSHPSSGVNSATPIAQTAGTPVALSASGASQLQEPSPGDVTGAGFGPSSGVPGAGSDPGVVPAENVFVPGRESGGPASQDLVDQPFTIRGQPRPYRDVLNEYAAASRDYVDRPDVSPAVRDMVKQYFQSLEEGS